MRGKDQGNTRKKQTTMLVELKETKREKIKEKKTVMRKLNGFHKDEKMNEEARKKKKIKYNSESLDLYVCERNLKKGMKK